MANKPLQSIKFPDLPDTYTIPVVDSTLAVSGAAADAKKTGDSLSDKVDKVSGKGLSTNDYTDEEKTKLAGVETGANKTVIDTTLTQTGQAADAKTVGDTIASEDKKALAAFATDTASGSIASFPDGADSIHMKDVLVHIKPVQAGSGDPSPDNVRPISGWTGAKVTRTGKNLLPSYAIGRQKTENGITATANADGSITYVGTSTGTFYGLGDSASISVKAGTYTLSARNNTDISINIVNAVTGSFIDRVTGSDSKVITFANDKKIYYLTTILSGKTVDTTATYQLELGSTATDYEPYHADTYDITFPSEAGTVYGGTLDVTSGVLTVDRAMVDPGKLDWENYNVSSTRVFRSTSLANAVLQYDGLNIICSNYPTVAASQRKDKSISIGSNSSVWIIDSSYSDLSAFKAAILGSQLVYELATPITYHLTPQEITSLLGTNNVWADTGNSDVEYRADTKVYVDAKVAAAESNITSLQNNKVDKTTPLLNFDDTATDPLTDDGALANALTALDVLDDVIPSGGDALYLKKVLTKIIEQLTVTSTSVALNATYAYTSGDTIKLVKVGKIVTLTIGILKALPNATVALGTIPEEYRPTKAEDVFIFEPSGTGASKSARITVNTNGAVTVYAYGDYSSAAIVNAHTRITYMCA